MSKEAMKLALEALEICAVRQEHQWHGLQKMSIAKAALREALAEQSAQQDLGRNHYEDGDVFERIAAMKRRTAEQEPVAVRLWDSQWVNVVNHDNCYRDWSKEDAINHAVKMTEKYIAGNVASNKLPPAQQEPVAMYEDWYNTNSCGHCGMVGGHTKICRHYTSQPQRTWVGLTDKEEVELWESTDSDWELMKRTEAKLKEKNT